MGKSAQKNMLPMQPGDVVTTYADVDDLMADVGFKPVTPLAEGLEKFIGWYREYYSKNPSANRNRLANGSLLVAGRSLAIPSKGENTLHEKTFY